MFGLCCDMELLEGKSLCTYAFVSYLNLRIGLGLQ